MKVSREMQEALDEVESAAAALTAAKARRDTAIRKAVKVGAPISRIANAASMSRQQIYNLSSE